MYYLPPTLISIFEVLLVIVPALLSVAYVTVAERKTMGRPLRAFGGRGRLMPKSPRAAWPPKEW